MNEQALIRGIRFDLDARPSCVQPLATQRNSDLMPTRIQAKAE